MPRAGQQGFTYLGLIILLAILGLVGAAGLKMGTLFERAAAEEELLEIGAQFSEALRSYAAATPAGQLKQPPTLQDLVRDPRFPNPRRHLRKIFVDPITGKAEWGIVYLGEKVGIVGVYSLSNRRPLKVANFDIRFQNMENRQRISDWKFMVAGGEGVPGTLFTPPNSPQAAAAPSLFNDPAQAASAASASAATPAAAPDVPPEPQPEGPAREEVEAESAAAQERAADAMAEAQRQAAEEAERRAEEALRQAEQGASSSGAASGPDPFAPPPPGKR
ncbi:MAG TPA: type II secretion system protein [Telluria sp.]